MKKVVAVLALSAASVPAAAAEFGLGVSVQSDDAWIYAPIDITPKFRIEPSLRFQSFESTSQTDLGFGEVAEIRQEGETWEFAVGVFGLAPIADKLHVYYGARLAYLDNESDLQISFGGGREADTQESSSDGYRISPTLGFEYRFTDHFSIGGEAEWFYQSTDSEGSRSDFGDTIRSNGELESNGTDTRLIVRFRF